MTAAAQQQRSINCLRVCIRICRLPSCLPKPRETTEALCEALKRNFVFAGISDKLLLEVRQHSNAATQALHQPRHHIARIGCKGEKEGACLVLCVMLDRQSMIGLDNENW